MSAIPDSTLADSERLIADLQRQLAECRAERDEALQRETATAEVLQVINSSPGDLTPVFDAMLERALGLCGAAFGILRTYDGECILAIAIRGADPEYVEFLRNRPVRPGPLTAHGRIVAGEDIIHIPDVSADEAFRSGDPRRRGLVQLGGARSYVVVALRKEGKLLGSIAAYRKEVRPFTDKQIALLQNFAAQAVVAMDNARLITETREALKQQTATAEVLGVINSSPGDLTPVFDAILEKAHDLCGATLGSLRIIEGDYIRSVATRGHSASFAEELREGSPVTEAPITNPLLNGASVVHISDVAVVDDPVARRSVERSGVRTALAVPLRKDK